MLISKSGSARLLPDDWVPPVYATLLYIVHDGQVLLIEKKTGHGAGKVNAPGGKLDPNETPRDCVIREVKEEVGLTVSSPKLGAILRFQDHENGFALQGFAFVGYEFEGTLVETNEAKPFWCNLHDIPYDLMWEDDQYWLPSLLQRKSIRGDFYFRNDQLETWSVEILDHGDFGTTADEPIS